MKDTREVQNSITFWLMEVYVLRYKKLFQDTEN